MKKLAKLTGALAVVAVFAVATISTSKAQEVSMDDVNITTAENLDIDLKDRWAIVSRDFVVAGSRD